MQEISEKSRALHMLLIALSVSTLVLIINMIAGVITIFGIGLGCMDSGSNMCGALGGIGVIFQWGIYPILYIILLLLSSILYGCKKYKAFNVSIQHHETQNVASHFGPQSQNLASVIRGFKIGVTKYCRQYTNVYAPWQSRFFDKIIRNKNELYSQ